jgi:hypothetical protein
VGDSSDQHVSLAGQEKAKERDDRANENRPGKQRCQVATTIAWAVIGEED